MLLLIMTFFVATNCKYLLHLHSNQNVSSYYLWMHIISSLRSSTSPDSRQKTALLPRYHSPRPATERWSLPSLLSEHPSWPWGATAQATTSSLSTASCPLTTKLPDLGVCLQFPGVQVRFTLQNTAEIRILRRAVTSILSQRLLHKMANSR